MKLYEIIIEPTTAFGTPLKGDTIFGHFCWQAAENDILQGGLAYWIKQYRERPFAVFSSAFPRIMDNGSPIYALPKPSMPLPARLGLSRGERYKSLKERKTVKKKNWMLTGADLQPNFSAAEYRSEEDLFLLHLEGLSADQQKDLRLLSGKRRRLCGNFEQAHNSINRLSMTTGSGQFAPFSSLNIHYQPQVQLAVFALLDSEAVDEKRLAAAFTNMGRWGFGRDASAGLGKFLVHDIRERPIPKAGGKKSVYTLAPSVPQKGSLAAAYFTPFTRFGKHGPALMHTGKPFKNPVVMADEGAVFTLEKIEDLQKPYIGTALTNLSKADERTVMQGYAIYLPCDIEELP